MLIDEVKIKVVAGNGGDGGVSFNSNMNSLGPTGATGGNGGNISAIGVSDISALGQFRYKKEFKAEDGKHGGVQYRDGRDGENLVLKLPVGTVIHNLTTGGEVSVDKIGEEIFLAHGGRGGKGNFHFRSATNTSPRESQPGTPGQIYDLHLELKLVADVGFVGLPNAGKSSMLNELTNAKTKVANYPFTTLEPNLGAYYELILADIPGLIEGSSTGKGLGIKFLRHVERTRILFHFISAESQNPLADYKTIRKELNAYNKKLTRKPQHLFLSKSDMLSKSELAAKMKIMKKIDPKVIAVSIHNMNSIKKIEKILNGIQRDK